MAGRVEGGEEEDAAGGVVVGDAAGDDHVGVDLHELPHRRAGVGEERDGERMRPCGLCGRWSSRGDREEPSHGNGSSSEKLFKK